ncbi:PIN domain protein [Echinicola strongylocentroti]|uniref:PIN domain protein n=1 Tax=Echinicola strongylocentroti TaxID=1795355 RepID=A0A2Z4ILS6_9BACT|nr:PIN domain-containing protein [Echinicola strongylocentroti]AWW31885.1 PIN domain protein [Echinicola strongylocentroti]
MNGVLVDTSVWIEYFRGNPDFIQPGLQLIQEGNAFSLEVIFAELAQGAKHKKEVAFIMEFFSHMKLLDYPGLAFGAGIYSQENKLVHHGVVLIDSIIILCAKTYDLKIWTLDKKIRRFVGYDMIFSAEHYFR